MEVGWKAPFSVFLMLFSSIYGVSKEEASSCNSAFSVGELGRATVAAAGVFEGRLQVVGGSPASSSSLFAAGQLNATFTFRRAYKGKFKRITRAAQRPQVVVRLAAVVETRLTRTDGASRCSLSDLLVLHQNYLIFVGKWVRSRNSVGQSGVVYFESTTFPVPATKDAVKHIRAYRCKKCGRIKTRLMPRTLTVHQGETVSLMCRTYGKPVEDIQWFKGEQPLTLTERIRAETARKGSRLVLENAEREDSGSYLCQASNAVTTTALSSSQVKVTPANTVLAKGHEVLCTAQDYCLNDGTCYILKSLGRKYCRCLLEYSGERCQEKQIPMIDQSDTSTVISHHDWWLATGQQSSIITVVAVATLLFACCLITVFCVARNYCRRKKRRRIARSDSDYRPPSLPDGHAVNVVHLNAAINRRSAAYSINLAADGSIEPIANHPEPTQQQPPDQELPVVRRLPRSSASSIPASAAARNSAQVRLSMLSNVSSQPGHPRLPAVPPASYSDVHEADRPADVGPRSESFVTPVEQIELERVGQVEIQGATVEETASPRASQCSHTESLLCAITSPDDGAAAEVASCVDVHSEASTAPRRHSFSNVAIGSPEADDSDISEPSDDGNYPGDDLEVNFESEADMLAVETSGDELERGGVMTSRDFSEMSSQVTTDRGSSDDDDDDLSDDPFMQQHLLGLLTAGTDGGSSGDLSWDASAEMPSFAVGSSAVETPLHFTKH